MAGLPALQVGKAVVVERHALIARLENAAAGDRFQWEMSSRARLLEDLDGRAGWRPDARYGFRPPPTSRVGPFRT
jgi:hypothetical protein